MTLNPEDLAGAARFLERTAAFYVIDTEASNGSRIHCCSSCSMPMAWMAKAGLRLFVDRRFLQLAGHASLAMVNHDQSFKLGSMSSHGSFHLEAVLWCAIAERALNPAARDVDLALGILGEPSPILYHYLPSLGPFSLALREAGWSALNMMGFFQLFVDAHEVAHLDMKSGVRPTDEMFDNFVAAAKLIDARRAQHQARSDVPPQIAELFAAAVEVRESKTLMEEVFADLMSLDTFQSTVRNPPYKVAVSGLTWFLARSALHGLAALRLLSLTDALRSRDRTQFDRRWEETRRLFNARSIYLETIFQLMVVREPEPEEAGPEDTHEAKLRRLNELNHRLFTITRQTEAQWHEWFCEGRMDELRSEGAQLRAERGLDEEEALFVCGERLGWFRDAG